MTLFSLVTRDFILKLPILNICSVCVCGGLWPRNIRWPKMAVGGSRSWWMPLRHPHRATRVRIRRGCGVLYPELLRTLLEGCFGDITAYGPSSPASSAAALPRWTGAFATSLWIQPQMPPMLTIVWVVRGLSAQPVGNGPGRSSVQRLLVFVTSFVVWTLLPSSRPHNNFYIIITLTAPGFGLC